MVASEVKQLAAQTAKATEEIGTQVAAIQGATGEAVRSIRDIGEVVGEIDRIAATIAAAVEEQGAATREIARNVAEAARGADDVSASIARVITGIGEANGTLRGLRDTTEAVAGQCEVLGVALDRVLEGPRAA